MSQIRDLETYSKILKFCPYILTLDCQMLITLDIAFKSKKKTKQNSILAIENRWRG